MAVAGILVVAVCVAWWMGATVKHRADVLWRYYLLEGDDLQYIAESRRQANQAGVLAEEARRAGWTEREQYWLRVAEWWDLKRDSHEEVLPLHSERRALYERAVKRPWVRVPPDDDPPRRPFVFEPVDHPFGPPPLPPSP
jgi:hypothetical protein